MIFVVVDVVLIVALTALAWRYRPRKRKLPGGPQDGKGCLTAYERVMFDRLTEPLDRESS